MIKRTLFWNFKGGQGKTTLALQIAMLEDAYIVANEGHSSVPDVLGSERGLAIKFNDPLPVVPRDVPLMYDFGGFAEARVVEAAQDSDYVVIPVAIKNLSSVLEIQGAIRAINAISPYNDNIIIVNNMTKKGHMQYVMDSFASVGMKYPILDIKDSTAFSRSISQNRSIVELMGDNNGLHKRPFEIALLQLRTLIKRISQ